MRFFLDTEFIEDGLTIDLLSIGVVCETGDVFYVENADADWTLASKWVRDNVLPHMAGSTAASWTPHDKIGQMLLSFIRQCHARELRETKTEFWAYYADYDWVALCQLFGTMMDLPKGFPMYCMDIKQLAMMLGNPDLPSQDGADEHYALADAKWGMAAFEFLHMTLTKDYGRFIAREMLR